MKNYCDTVERKIQVAKEALRKASLPGSSQDERVLGDMLKAQDAELTLLEMKAQQASILDEKDAARAEIAERLEALKDIEKALTVGGGSVRRDTTPFTTNSYGTIIHTGNRKRR